MVNFEDVLLWWVFACRKTYQIDKSSDDTDTFCVTIDLKKGPYSKDHNDDVKKDDVQMLEKQLQEIKEQVN